MTGDCHVRFCERVQGQFLCSTRLIMKKLARPLQKGLDNVAKVINPYIRGIINYYGKFYQSELDEIWRILDARLVRWIMKKHKRYKGKKTKAFKLLEEIKSSVRYRGLFAHWQFKLNTKAKTA